MSDNLYILLLIATAGIVLLATIPLLLAFVYRNRILEQQKAMQLADLEHQKSLVQAIVQSQEQERNYTGRELHDNIMNSIMVLNLLIEKNDKQAALQLSSKIVTGIRALSHKLAPSALRLFGLQEALIELAEQIEETNQYDVTMHLDESFDGAGMSYETTLHLYRIIQELVTNTLKYANAKSISIRLKLIDESLYLFYSDDGKGFEYTNKKIRSNGMYNIESRLQVLQATSRMYSAPGKGMLMEICLPLLHNHTISTYDNNSYC